MRPEYLGRRVACKHCDHKFIAAASEPPQDSGSSEIPSLEEIWDRENQREEAPSQPPIPARPPGPRPGPVAGDRVAKHDIEDSSSLIPVHREPPAEPEPAGQSTTPAATPASELESLRAENAWLRAEVESLREELNAFRDRDGSLPDF